MMNSPQPLLHFRRLHEHAQGVPVVLVHGLFGAAENLLGIGRAFPDRPVLSVDLRNHGRSFHRSSMTFAEMATDLEAVIDAQGWDSVDLVGHSLGGKVSIQLAQMRPEKVRRLVVADIAPVTYPPGHQTILEGLQAIDPSQVSGRKDADDILKRFEPEPGVRGFLLMNLVKGDGDGYHWRFNLQGLIDNYAALRSAPDLIKPYAGKALYIRGGKSSYIREQNKEAIKQYTPNAQIETLEGCGHWLHAEKPAEFNRLVTEFLNAEDSGP